MKKTSDATIAEARRLRIDERKSSRDISRIIGVPIGTLSSYLRDIPLTSNEITNIQSETAVSMNSQRGDRIPKVCPPAHPDHNPESHSCLSTSQKGASSEMAVRLMLIEKGLIPLIPDIPGLRYDMIAHDIDHNRYSRIQVKTAQPRKFGMPYFNIVVNRNGIKFQYEPDDFDVLIVYHQQSRIFYVMDKHDLSHKMTGKRCSSAGIPVKAIDEGRWDKLFTSL